MSLIRCLEGLTSKRTYGTQWGDTSPEDPGTYSSLETYEVWARSKALMPLRSQTRDVKEADALNQFQGPPKDQNVTGGMKILVFHDWKDSQTKNSRKAKVIRGALALLDMPTWLPARFFTHSFYVDPGNLSMRNSRSKRKYWQRFQGGLLLWTHDIKSHTTRAVFLCHEEQHWKAFKKNLQQCLNYAALPLLPGVLAYTQQIQVSVSYVHSVREKFNSMLASVSSNPLIVGTPPGEESWNLKEKKFSREQLAFVENNIRELTRCARDAAASTLYLNDNSGHLKRILSSLDFIKTEHEAYREIIAGHLDPTWNLELTNQAKELSGVIDDLAIEVNSQLLAVDSIATNIDALVKSSNFTINSLIAGSSVKIAVESRSNDLPMMTIAVITFLFLLGTFVASSFAMLLLSRNAQHVDEVSIDRLMGYWAVTILLIILLTVFVIFCWSIFIQIKDSLHPLPSPSRGLVERHHNSNDAETSQGATNSSNQHGSTVTAGSASARTNFNNMAASQRPRKFPTSAVRMQPMTRIDELKFEG